MYKKLFDLSNKNIVILGGLGTLGLEISKGILEFNSNLFILDNNKKNADKFLKKNKKYKNKIIFYHFDSSDTINFENNFKFIMNKIKKLDVFINTSYPKTDDWAKNSFDNILFNSFRKNIDIHLNTYAWLGHLVAKKMSKNKTGGSIILMSSIYGLVAQDMDLYKDTEGINNMTYPIIKSGIIHASKQIASYYGSKKIRVNSICPGPIDGHVPGISSKQSKKFKTKLSNKTLLKRLGKASEVASVVLFLSCDASSFVTGSNIVVDGGWTAI